MKLKQSKWLLLTIITVFMLSIVLEVPRALADTLTDLKSEQKQLEEKKGSISSSIKEKESEIKTNQSSIETLLAKIAELSKKITATNEQIDTVNAEITKTSQEINELKASIEELEKKIEERDKLIRERIRAVQKSGGSVSYIDVLLGANSFMDFIDRFSAVNKLMEADRKILEEQAEDKLSLEDQKALVEKKLADQKASKAQLVDLKANLDSQKASQNKLIDQLEAEQAKLKDEKQNLEEQYADVVEVSADLESQISAEQKRIAELARKAEEERKRKAAEAAKAAKNNSNGGSVPAISSGTWTTPAAGPITSPFGYRNIFGGISFHYGVDVGNDTGTAIVSSGDGVVSFTGPFSTYGKTIMVTHSVDGQIYTTLYAHLSSINVSVGQSVSKGELIGRMGNTGRSTGPHLHFEFHVWSLVK